jgi:hypothetical protein
MTNEARSLASNEGMQIYLPAGMLTIRAGEEFATAREKERPSTSLPFITVPLDGVRYPSTVVRLPFDRLRARALSRLADSQLCSPLGFPLAYLGG